MAHRKYPSTTLLIVITSLVIAVLLGGALWDINFWPTDTKVYYFDAAVQLSQFQHLSQIHQTIAAEKVFWLHGKEIYILAVSLMQRLINDFETLRPFILVCIMAVCFSSILIYLIVRKYWGRFVAIFCYFIFTACMWPYIYILFAKHQPLGLFFFLFALFLLQHIRVKKIGKVFYYLSGISMGLALFSSTVSSLYLPYFMAGFIHQVAVHARAGKQNIKKTAGHVLWTGGLVSLGLLTTVVYVNYPNVVGNIKNYLEYVHISGAYNHFFYNQAFLQQWFQGVEVASVRGGFLWIIKYFFVIMPVLFPLYLFGVIYLVVKCFRGSNSFKIITLGIILLSFSSPLMAELARVAQYGANYFPSIIGIITLLGYGVYLFKKDDWPKLKHSKYGFLTLLLAIVLLTTHAGINLYIFLTDIYPSRMVTTFLSREIKARGIEKIYTHMYNPHHANFILYLNPELQRKLEFVRINYLVQPKEGYILIPPVTGDSVYIASISLYKEFDKDVFLNELFRKGNIDEYVVSSYRTLANSRIWLHEEEILSYRKLILNHNIPETGLKGRVLLLDAKKIQADVNDNVPIKEYLGLFQKKISNIGTEKKVYIYEGYTGQFSGKKLLTNLLARIYKVGNPQDSLVAYVYKVDEDQVVWVRHGEQFASEPLEGEVLSRDPNKGLAVFKFNPSLKLTGKHYFFLIYRTGPPDDENFYRVYNDSLAIM